MPRARLFLEQLHFQNVEILRATPLLSLDSCMVRLSLSYSCFAARFLWPVIIANVESMDGARRPFHMRVCRAPLPPASSETSADANALRAAWERKCAMSAQGMCARTRSFVRGFIL